MLAFLAVIGLIASFHTIIYAYGRQIYSLARAGYYLPFMSLTNDKKVPHMALYVGTALGFATMMILWYVLGSEKGGAIIGSTLLNMAVFGAMISYAMQGLSFILLRKNMPNIVRPYRSPVGVPGAVVTIVVALVTIYYQLQDPDVPEGGACGGRVLRARHSLLRGRWQEPAHPVARRRVRAQQG